jgi:hypothetical protein
VRRKDSSVRLILIFYPVAGRKAREASTRRGGERRGGMGDHEIGVLSTLPHRKSRTFRRCAALSTAFLSPRSRLHTLLHPYSLLRRTAHSLLPRRAASTSSSLPAPPKRRQELAPQACVGSIRSEGEVGFYPHALARDLVFSFIVPPAAILLLALKYIETNGLTVQRPRSDLRGDSTSLFSSDQLRASE